MIFDLSFDPLSAPTLPPTGLEHAAEDALMHIFDHVECGVVVYDRHGAIQEANQRACELLGVSPDQIYGRTSFDVRWHAVDQAGNIVPPESFPSVQARDTGKAVRNVLLGIYRASSTDRAWLLTSAVPRPSPSGGVAGVVVTLVDVTDRMRVEHAHEAERVLRAEVMRTVPAGILVLDRNSMVQLASDEARRLLGLEELTGGPVRLRGTLVDERGTPLTPDQLPGERVRTNRRPLVGARYVWTSSSGRRRILLVNGARLNSEHWPDGVVLSFNDITQQEATTRAIRHSERRLAAALKAADLGRFIVDFSRRCVSADREWLARHDFPLELAESDFDLWRAQLDSFDGEGLREAVAEHLKGNTSNLEIEFWLRTRLGRTRRVRCIGQVLERSASGRADSMSGVLMDITAEFEAKLAEQRLEARAAEMARLEGISAVAGGVAHTFSNLLVGVMGAVTAAREGIDDHSPLALALDQLAEASQRAGEVTTQLRAISGGNQFALRGVRLDEFIQSVSGMLEMGLSERASLCTSVEGTIPPVEVDVDQLRLVLMNLVLNAADASSPEGTGVILRVRPFTVRPEVVLPGLATPDAPAPGEYVMVEVADHGHGMTPQTRDQMFRPFFTTRSGNSGLGLSAVLGIARGHKGFVQVHSVEGEGTTVCIGLPVVDALALSPPEVPVPTAARSNGPSRVLVVDDESMIRRLVGRVLERAGHEVTMVPDGQAALDVLEEEAEQFQLMLLDLTMPGLSGREVLEESRHRWPELPVVVMSGYSDDALVGRLMARWGVQFLAKPFGAAGLREVVTSVVGERVLAEA